MNTEIELKFLVSSKSPQETIQQYLTENNIEFVKKIKDLGNCYFDTADQQLRHMDMGLRVRTCDGANEQTIKTAGVVIGGLHQRPEYNVNIENLFPKLSLFPDQIWPENQNISNLENQLTSLFNTNFTRTLWTLKTESNARIELAFDFGTVSTDGTSEDICELELELLEGDREALFTLAKDLFEVLDVRPGIKSKAARGYALWLKQDTTADITPFELIKIPANAVIDKAFSHGMSYALTQLQKMIDAYLNEPSLPYLAKVVELLALIRHGFWMFESHLPAAAEAIRDELSHFLQLFQWVDGAVYLKELTNKTGNYRKRIDLSRQLSEQLKIEKRRYPDAEQVIELIVSARFNRLQLDLLALFLQIDGQDNETSNQANEAVIDNQSELLKSNQRTLLKFASKCLKVSAINVFSDNDHKPTMTSEEYLREQKFVVRHLLTGSWFGSLFDKEKRLTYRSPWLDIKVGLSELQTLWVLQKQLHLLDEMPQKLVNWHHSKVESLILALDSSRDTATNIPKYWLDIERFISPSI